MANVRMIGKSMWCANIDGADEDDDDDGDDDDDDDCFVFVLKHYFYSV